MNNKGIISWFVQNPVAANLLMAFIIISGFLSSDVVKKELLPKPEINRFTITTFYPSASPQEIEQSITLKIEDGIRDITGIKEIHASSTTGASIIRVEILKGFDVDSILDEVKAVVDGIGTLPEDAEKPIIKRPKPLELAVQLQLYGDISEAELKLMAEELKREILSTTIIKRVDIWGGRPYEIAIEATEAQLQKYGLTLAQIADTIEQESINAPSGLLQTDKGNFIIRVEGQSYTQEDFENITLISKADGTRVTLGDIASVKDGFVEWDTYALFDGKYSIGLSISAIADQDVIEVSKAAIAFMENKRSALPEGVYLAEWADTTHYLNGRLTMMIKNMVLGGILVFIILALFMNLRIAFWVMIGLPVCYFGIFILMPLEGFNVSLNMVTLFGLILVLGIIVDDAIVVAESVDHEVRHSGLSKESVIRGTKRVALPAIFGVLTTIVAFVPTLLAEGPQSVFLYSIGFVVCACLVFSLIESKLILPAHLASGDHNLLKYMKNEKQDKLQQKINKNLVAWVEAKYRPFLEVAIQNRYTTLSAFIGIFIIAVGLLASGTVKYILYPPEPNDFLMVKFSLNEGAEEGSAEAAMEKILSGAHKMEEEYRMEFNREEGLIKHIFQWNTHELDGNFMVELIKAEDREIDSFEIISRWREAVAPIDNISSLNFIAEIGQRHSRNLSFNLVGSDIQKLQEAAEDLYNEIIKYDGITDVVNPVNQQREDLVMELKPKARAMGLTLANIAVQVKHAFYGAEAQRVVRDNEEIKVLVRYPKNSRNSLADLEKVFIKLNNGTSIPLTELVNIEKKLAPQNLVRIDGQYTYTVTASVDSSVDDPGKIKSQINQAFMPKLKSFYKGVSYSRRGIDIDQQRLEKDARKFFFMAMLGVFILLAIPLKSYTQPIIIMSAIPFGLIGAVIGHLIFNIPVSLMSIFGIIALVGVVVNDSLIMVDFINRAEREGMEEKEAILQAGAKRFRAIILTTLTTFFGIFPMMLETSLQAQNMIPMAVSLGFGIMFATAITLVLVPCLYAILGDLRTLREKLEARLTGSA